MGQPSLAPADCPLPIAAPLGIIANPASGKDIRRLVAHASVFDNAEKSSIIRRLVLGAHAAGARRFHFLTDRHRLVETALAHLPLADASFEPVASPGAQTALDTTRAATAMREAGCGVVVTLGGDGTNRAAVGGWEAMPLIALSTGTNNVFPRMMEATVAGTAAGLVATGAIPLEAVSARAKCVRIAVDGEPPDLALIDAVVVEGRFTGSRALWDVAALRLAVLARAEPAAVGFAAVGGLLRPVSAADDGGLLIEFGEPGEAVIAPIAPGLFRAVSVRRVAGLRLGELIEVIGPGLLALDGERERTLKPGQRAVLTVRRDGPRVIDVEAALTLAAGRGLFRRSGVCRSVGENDDGD